MKTRLLGLGVFAALWASTLTGCGTGDSNLALDPGPAVETPVTPVGDLTKGTVHIFLSEPGLEGDVEPELRGQTLTYFGIDDQGNVTFEPVTLPFNAEQVLENVPPETTTIIIQDPDDPEVLGVEQVTVLPGQTTYISDVVLFPAPGDIAPLVGLTSPKLTDNPPTVDVGPGAIQLTLSKIGEPGANNTLAGAKATSAADDLKPPYRTNSWVSPILYADNKSKAFLGPDYDSGKPEVIDQRPAYSHPWIIGYSTQEPATFGRANPPVPDALAKGFPINKGLKLIAEVPRFVNGGGVPTKDAGNATEFYGAFETVPGPFDQLQLDPGFLADRLKVVRMGDYDAEFILRAVDDPNFNNLKPALPKTANLRLSSVRGNPLIYFTATDLPQVNLYNILSNLVNTLPTKQGVIKVGNVSIAYVAWSGKYRPGNDAVDLSSVLFFPQDAATYAQASVVNNDGAGGDGLRSVKSTLTFKNPKLNYFVVANLPGATFVEDGTLAKLAAAAFSYPTDTRVVYKYNQAEQVSDVTYTTTTKNVLNLPNVTISGLMPHHYQASGVHNNDPILAPGPSVLANTAGSPMVFLLSQGPLQVYTTGSWSCRYPIPGIMPFLPAITDAGAKTELRNWIVNGYVGKWGFSIPPFTNKNAGKGSQSYQIAKFMLRNMNLLFALDSTGAITYKNNNQDVNVGTATLANTKLAIQEYFPKVPVQTTQQPGSAPYYTYYDKFVGTLNQYPQGQPPGNPNFPSDTNVKPHEAFGATTRINDHHFHYGYFIHAAALIAIKDPAWATTWKDAINQYVFDCANNPEVNPKPDPTLKYPKERNWDAFMNHGVASALTWTFVEGNNEESCSEEANFWIGMALWGAMTGQKGMEEQALAHFGALAHSIHVYWFDVNLNKRKLADSIKNSKLNWGITDASKPGGLNGALIQEGRTQVTTFFNAHPAATRVITVLPVGSQTFYLAMNPAYVAQASADYLKFIKDRQIDPFQPAVFQDKNGGPFSIDNPWLFLMIYNPQLEKWFAMADPANAFNTYLGTGLGKGKVPNDRVVVNNGKSRKNPQADDNPIPIDLSCDEGDTIAHSFLFTQQLKELGKPDTWIKAKNSAYYMVFVDTAGKKRNYVGFNPTASPITINFTDGTVISSIPARSVKTTTVTIP